MTTPATSTGRRPPGTTILVNGPALRELRIRSGVEMAELADEIGVGRPYLNKIELGGRRVREEVYDAIIRAMKIRDRRVLMADTQAHQGSAE